MFATPGKTFALVYEILHKGIRTASRGLLMNNNDLYFNRLTLSAETAVINRGPGHYIKNLQ